MGISPSSVLIASVFLVNPGLLADKFSVKISENLDTENCTVTLQKLQVLTTL